MYSFNKNLYTDVRIENVFKTEISFLNDSIKQFKETDYIAAFIRVFDGERWYYASTTDLDSIQNQINELYISAKENENILDHPTIKKYEVHTGDFRCYIDTNIKNIDIGEKKELIMNYTKDLKHDYLKMLPSSYNDTHVEKHFISSLGSDIKSDVQFCGFGVNFSVAFGEKQFSDGYQYVDTTFDALLNKNDKLQEKLLKVCNFVEHSQNITPGDYTIVLSPMAAGIFAHESFGHKSEADFMVGDETMKKEWAIGTKVGADILSIVDDGNLRATGYTPFDDEGTKARKSYLINKGILSDRLHSCLTAASLEESPTGNARAMNFEYEPIVRMTNTYIEGGSKTLDELISEIEDGILVETVSHGSGMSTFTLAPNLSYRIKNGKIAEPVVVPVITGTVFETLNEIDGLTKDVEMLSFLRGGCGKMEQHPLPVGFGGPYVRVKKMKVQ